MNTPNKQLVRLKKKLLHYTGKAISDFNMIQKGDRVMLCLSGGKDSFTLLYLLNQLRIRSNNKFELFSFTLDQGQPGWDDSKLRAWMETQKIPYEVYKQDTYSVVIDKIPENKTYCSLCSRLRRGSIYTYAAKHGYTKIALGHHRDDMIQSLMMSILYNGEIKSMPPKLLTNSKEHILVRPLTYCQEKDIAAFAELMEFPIIPCNLCGSQENLARQKIKRLINELADENEKIPSNMLHALQAVQPSQLMDKRHWDFKNLEKQRQQTSNEISSTADADPF